MKKEFFAGKKVLIMGLGRFGGGVDVAKFAVNAGATVTVTDIAAAQHLADPISQLQEFGAIEYHLGSHELGDFEQADIIIVNPAVPPDNEFLEFARRHNKFITSQINIFFELSPATTIGITGANGKSTTAALTAHLLRAASARKGFKYRKVVLSGNIGNEPLMTRIDEISPDDLVVLELSSFQAEQLPQIRKAPKVALLTNLTPNHLDRHGTFADYCRAKENIFRFQRLDEAHPAVSIFNGQDEVGCKWFEKYRSEKWRVCMKFSADDLSAEIREEFTLPGRANLSNLAAAVAIAKIFGVEDQWIKACLGEFKPLPHRLELVAEIRGVRWYNDSIATTPQSTIAALEAFDGPIIIIAGGYDKELAFDELGEKISEKAKAAVLIGATAEKISKAIIGGCENHAQIEFADSLTQAVEKAGRLALSGDVVMLSPACASYDMFDNFQHRGQEFTGLVRVLKA